ncbi:MAG: shikimate dehydrogenase [Chloroflexi bacterium]|nr:MAG: shikimate dehydrogenase [Chloroflexota bacterium]
MGAVNYILLFGNPVSRSLSPVMQNAAFAASGIDCRYELREVDAGGLPGAIAELRGDERIVGANVTIPHKEAVIAFLDDLDPQAARIGAVNTISRQGARLTGWNTDVVGFLRALAEVDTSNSPSPSGGRQGGGYRVAIIGAGGAARAVAAALQPAAGEIWIIARNLEQARRLCTDLGIDRGGPVDLTRLRETMARVDLVVNATPADLPPAAWLKPDQRTFDLRSRRSVEGRAMLLHQGAASFEIWTGRPAPIDVMRAALDRAPVPA